MSIITTRRDFLAWSAAALATPGVGAESLTHQATGVKIGEITPASVRFSRP